MKKLSETIVILGGSSAIAVAYARAAAQTGDQIVLVGRSKKKLETVAADCNARGDETPVTFVTDLSKTKNIANVWQSILDQVGDVDRVLLAYGVLGDQEETQTGLDMLEKNLQTNFVSACVWCETAFSYFRTIGQGQLSVIGSVAGDRGRQSNYHYGSAKGGLDIFLQGMSHRAAKLKEADINVLLVKPGFVDTPMTAHIEKGGPLWATPEKIAGIIRDSEEKGRRVVYAPWFWRFILLIIRYVPFFVFKRTSL